MNNNKLCPSCRHPLPTNTCKRCGYKIQTLQVVDTQQEFGRFHHGSRIRRTVQQGPRTKVLTKEEKLSLYLREYQQLIKTALSKLIASQQLSRDDAQHFRKQVKILWQGYLLRKSQMKSPIVGMFWKYLTNSHQVEEKKDIPEPQDDKSDDSSKEEEEVVMPSRKRGRPPKSAALQAKQLSKVTQLRCYYNISVKPLIVDSTEARKVTADELTPAQKSFLSYLLALKEIDEQLLKVASTKYLNLLLAIQGVKMEKSYIKDCIVQSELRQRKAAMMKKREHSTLLILLIDLLKDWSLNYGEIQTRGLLRLMLNEYERSMHKSSVIDKILEETRRDRKEEDPNSPTLNFELIYSLIYVASTKAGLTLTVGEVITGCGPLQIKKIPIEEDLHLPCVPNEEAISSQRVRKGSHLLAHYLKASFPVQIGRWSVKWCQKLDIMSQVSRVQMINSIIFAEAKEKINKCQRRQGKTQSYHKLFELEQDIASMAGVIVFTKLSHGLTNYPFLLHTQTDQLEKQFNFEGKEYEVLKKLIRNKAVIVKKQDKSLIRRQIPEVYHQTFPILQLIRRVSHLNTHDKEVGLNTFNEGMLRLRNLSDLNGLTSIRLMEWSKQLKESRNGQTKLRYKEDQHVQWVNELNRKKKAASIKTIPLKHNKDIGELSDNIKNQLGCIVGNQQQLTQQQTPQREPCLLDEPSANYELMFQYSGDNLCMAERKQKLLLLEGLCFNYCSFGQLVGWLSHYQAVLKCFEEK